MKRGPRSAAVLWEAVGSPLRCLGLSAGVVLGATTAWAQPDYAPAHWTPPGCTKWYSPGQGFGHSFCVIHDMEGYYQGSISYLNRCDTNASGVYNVDASVYYLVNGVQNGPGENNPGDPAAGDITQSVREANYAWHAVCWNKYMFGTEHEGFVSNPAWYTEAMYQASAGLQKHLCDAYGIPKDRNHIIGHNEWQNPAWTSWMAANWPQIDTTCNTHTDPGIFWDWSHFMALIAGGNTNIGVYWDRNGSAPGAGTAPSGTWDMSSTNWSSDPGGAVAPGLWATQTAIFSAGSDASSSYTITVAGTIGVNNLLVQDGTVTFTGGQLDFKGFGSYYSNYVAAGCTAIFNTPFGGTGSPDKWGPGLAVYQGASSSGGYFSLNQGSLGLGNNSALGTVPLHVGDPTGANFVTLQSADSTARSLPNMLVLYANSFSFGAGGNLTFSSYVDMGANSGAATTISVSNSVTTLSGILTNTAGLAKAGPGTLTLSGAGANTFGSTSANGNTTVNAGTLKLAKTSGVAAIANGKIILNAGGNLLLGASDQIADAVPMTLAGGAFQTAGFNEQLGTLQLTANSSIDLGGGASVLKFASTSGVPWTGGAVLTVTNWSGSINGGGTDRLIFGANGSALTAGQVAQIRFANPPGFPAGSFAATILSSGEVVPLTALPVVTVQPTNRVAVVGDSLSFTTVATGVPAPAYQWRFYGTNLPAGTAATLSLSSVTLSQAGTYFAVISNIAGTTSSSNATLMVFTTAVPTLNGIAYSADGRFQLSLAGVPGYSYAILASTNLAAWLPLQTNSSPFSFTDSNAGAFPYRFYRGQYLP